MTRGRRGWVHKTANVLNKLPNLRGVSQFFMDPHRAYGLRRAVSAQAPRGELGRKRLDTQVGEVWRVSHE